MCVREGERDKQRYSFDHVQRNNTSRFHGNKYKEGMELGSQRKHTKIKDVHSHCQFGEEGEVNVGVIFVVVRRRRHSFGSMLPTIECALWMSAGENKVSSDWTNQEVDKYLVAKVHSTHVATVFLFHFTASLFVEIVFECSQNGTQVALLCTMFTKLVDQFVTSHFVKVLLVRAGGHKVHLDLVTCALVHDDC